MDKTIDINVSEEGISGLEHYAVLVSKGEKFEEDKSKPKH